jgi:plastocyanin
MRTLTRMLVLAIGISLIGVAWPVPAGASGGGGCGRPITQARGTIVHIKNFCFRPTVLQAAVGDTITWVNRDPFEHTVLGANGAWGSYDVLQQGGMMSYRFDDPGVYPFVCTLHTGMVGSVSISDSMDGAVGANIEPTSVVPTATTTETAPAAVETPRTVVRVERLVASPVGWQVVAGSSWALLIVAAGGLWMIRRKRHLAPRHDESEMVSNRGVEPQPA